MLGLGIPFNHKPAQLMKKPSGMVKSDMFMYLGLEESKKSKIVFKTDKISSGMQLADCLNLTEGQTSDLAFFSEN